MKLFRHLVAATLLVLAAAGQALAQTTLNSTTLSGAVAATGQIVPLASVANITAGDVIVVLHANQVAEAMQVNAVNTASVTVTRGVEGTAARAHVSGATVYTGDRERFSGSTPVGACTATNQQFLPNIALPAGTVSQCSPAGVWYRLDQTFNVVCRTLLAADSIDQSCWQADGNYVLIAIREVHTTAESAGTLTLIPRRQQGTEAAASGDALATAIDMVGAGAVAQTVKTATLTTTVADLFLDSGDRLGLDFTDDVAGELAGVTVTFTLARW